MADRSTPPKKSLGQHWLNDQLSLEAICAAAHVRPSDVVLEIGPGQGSLTKVLLQQGARVIAVELDQRLALQLRVRFADEAFELHEASILEFDLTSLPKGYKLVANIPYYLTSHLIRVVSESRNPPAVAALLMQKEVAERVAASLGSMSLLSVTAQFYWEVSLGIEVPAHLFIPPPKVDSQVLVLSKRQKPLFELDTERFFQVVKAGFSARRKKLRSSLSAGLRCDKATVEGILEKAGVSSDKRPQALSLDDWYAVYQAIESVELLEQDQGK